MEHTHQTSKPKFKRVKHSTYGYVRSEVTVHASDSPMAVVVVDTPRDTVSPHDVLVVGKSALSDTGGYTKPHRPSATRVEQYMPLVHSVVKMLRRPQDDWEELVAEGYLALAEADAKHDPSKNATFAPYARSYITGFILKLQNPVRQGTAHLKQLEECHEIIAAPEGDANLKDFTRTLHGTLHEMTTKQREVILHILKGHTLENVGQIMGITRQSAEKLRDRALDPVKRKMRKDNDL